MFKLKKKIDYPQTVFSILFGGIFLVTGLIAAVSELIYPQYSRFENIMIAIIVALVGGYILFRWYRNLSK